MHPPRGHRTPASKSREYAVERRSFARSVPTVGKERREPIEQEIEQLVSLEYPCPFVSELSAAFFATVPKIYLASRPAECGNGMSGSEAHCKMVLVSAADYCRLIG